MTETLTRGGVEHTDDKDGDAGQVQVHPGHLDEKHVYLADKKKQTKIFSG